MPFQPRVAILVPAPDYYEKWQPAFARKAAALTAAGSVAAAVSLDDFYLTRARRHALARTVHPLLATRGVPGTHDLPLLLDVLLRVRSGRPVRLPVFDKLAVRDRMQLALLVARVRM